MEKKEEISLISSLPHRPLQALPTISAQASVPSGPLCPTRNSEDEKSHKNPVKVLKGREAFNGQ
jgi:hypothetical protein